MSGFDGDQNVQWQYVTKFRKTTGRNLASEGASRAVNTREPGVQPAPAQVIPEQMLPKPPPELPDVGDVPEPTEDAAPEGAQVLGRWLARHKPFQRLRDSIDQGLLANLSAIEDDYVEVALLDALEEEEYRLQDLPILWPTLPVGITILCPWIKPFEPQTRKSF